MPSMLETIILIAILTIPSCFLAVKYFLKKETNIYFDKRIEQFKSDLRLLTKQAEFDYTRKTVAFNLFFEKKHESYFEFYDMVTKAIGLVHSLYGFRRDTPIEMMRIPDIEIAMKVNGCSEALVLDYMSKIEKLGIDAVRDDLKKLMRSIEFNKAEMACVEAKNHLIVSRLYFEPSLFGICSSLCNQLLNLQIEFRCACDMPGSGNSVKQKEYTTNVDKLLEDATRLMQSELGVGYFEQETRKNSTQIVTAE